MKTVTENPIFFFMDAPPMFSTGVNDTRKIVELWDTGCDAREPFTALSRNTGRPNQSESPKPSNDENCGQYSDEQSGNKFHGDRFRGRNERNEMDIGKMYFIPRDDESGHQVLYQRLGIANTDISIRIYHYSAHFDEQLRRLFFFYLCLLSAKTLLRVRGDA